MAFGGLIAFFIYATNLSDGGRADQMRRISASSIQIIETSPETLSAKSLNDVLPNSGQLKDSEVLEEAELLLASNDAEQFNNGLLVLNELSARENSRASYILAQLYENGIRVPKDLDKALALYQKAALSGSEDANIYVFNHYLDNDNMDADHLKEALYWFMQAASYANNPIADYGLAHIYAKGLGVSVDEQKAVEYYQKAASENFVLAYEPLGDFYLQSSDDPKKISDALLLFQRAANEDIASAQYKLGYMYEAGLGAKQDYETARFWYKKASSNHFMKANIALGLMYANGFGIDKDNVQAYEFYRVAAEAGDPVAQSSIARAFERGLGVDQDLERAIFWYAEAAKQNDGYAEYNLGRIFEEYESVRNLDDAKAWYARAANSNISEAKNALNRLAK